jgi:thymidine phosphorylase
MTGQAKGLADSRRKAELALDSGAALAKWEQLLEAQGTQMDEYRQMLRRESIAAVTFEITAPAAGRVCDINGHRIGAILRDHGAGRLNQGAVIRPEVGLDRICPLYATVNRGTVLARIHAGAQSEAHVMADQLRPAFVLAP